MTIGPAPIIRIVERSVRFGIALPARIDRAQKKAASPAPPRKLPPACGRLSVAAAGALSHNPGRGKSMAGLPDRIGRVMHNRPGYLVLRFHRATVRSAAGDGRHHDMPAVDLPGCLGRRSVITSA